MIPRDRPLLLLLLLKSFSFSFSHLFPYDLESVHIIPVLGLIGIKA